MKLGFGLVTCQRYPGDPRTPTDLYREAIETAKLCEDEGLDSIWMSEHHFWDDDYMPSLLITASAMAAATQNIEVGTAVLLAPLYDPIRLAEDAATVDLISQGRFILGLGAGWRVEEFDRLGKSMDSLGKQMSEIVKVLRAAWGPSTFTFKGKFLNYEPTNVTPKPSRSIPIYLGGFADDALRRAGRIGDGFIGSTSRGGALNEYLAFVHEGVQKSGRDPNTFPAAIHFRVWIGDEQEIDEVIPYVWNMQWKYQDMGSEFARGTDGPLPDPPPLIDDLRAKVRSSMVAGSVEEVAAEISRLNEQAGENFHFIARSWIPGVPYEKTQQVVRRLGQVKKLLL